MKIANSLKKFILSAMAGGLLWSCSSDSEQKYFAAKIDDSDRWSIIDGASGEVICKDEFKGDVEIDGNRLWLQTEDGSIELYDVEEHKTALGGEFLAVGYFGKSDVTVAVKEGAPISIINRKGEAVVTLPKNIIYASPFSDGLADFKQDTLYGYMDEKGRTVIKPQYTSCWQFSDGCAKVLIEKEEAVECRFIDKSGKTLFSIKDGKYEQIGNFFYNGYLPVLKGDRVVLLDKEGNEVVKSSKMEAPKYHFQISSYRVDDGKFAYCNDGDWGLMSLDGESLIRPKYGDLFYIGDDKYLVDKDGKSGVIDSEGKDVFTDEYEYIIPNVAGNNYLLNDGKIWILADAKWKQIGKDEFSALSVGRRITSIQVKSNYFDMDGAVSGLAAEIGTKECFGVGRISAPEAVEQRILTHSVNLEDSRFRNTTEFSHILPVLGIVSVEYEFDGYIASPIMEQVDSFWRGSYETVAGYELNKEARIIKASVSIDFGDFKKQTVAFCDKLKAKLLASGFKETETVIANPYCMLESDGCYLSVELDDDNSSVKIFYQYKLTDSELSAETVAADSVAVE